MSHESVRRLPDEILARLLAKAEAQHPDVPVPRDRFAALVARCISSESSQPLDPEQLHVEDLYLACAYGLGVESAQSQIETQHFARIKRRLDRMKVPPSSTAEILQELRCRLVEMTEPGFSGAAYSGRGSLGGWLFITAVRIADRRSERAQHELTAHEGALDAADRLLPVLDPEMEHRVQSYKATFQAAMQEGLAALSRRERNLLRFHFLERLSIDRLSEIYQVHRATTARWLLRAQQHLAEETRSRFIAQIPTAENSMPRLLDLIRSKLDLSLSGILQRTAEPES